MGTIETTKEVFELIFSEGLTWQKTVNLEQANKLYYYNPKLEQKGIMLHNFINDTFQYYLIDINM